ncbi:hypothetical protein TNCV_3717951, partial [Trichonephila clavipes]
HPRQTTNLRDILHAVKIIRGDRCGFSKSHENPSTLDGVETHSLRCQNDSDKPINTPPSWQSKEEL